VTLTVDGWVGTFVFYFEFRGIMFDLLELLVMMPLVGMGCKNSTG